MLKVAIDVTALRAKPSGIGMYIYNLVQALTKLQSSENFVLNLTYQPSIKKWLRGDFSFSHQTDFSLDSYCLPLPVTFSSLLANFPNPILPYLESSLKYPDILQGTDHYVYPCRHSKNILTIHDLTFVKYPDYVNSVVKNYTRRLQQCMKWTDLIITFSHNSKKEISEYFQIDTNKILVTPQASRFSNLQLSPVDINQVNYDFSRPYFLFVSTIEPRKNLINLVTAFNYLKKSEKIEHQLVLIGQKGWNYQGILEAIATSPYKEEIHHLNYLSDELVAYFYRHATLFVYPSYYEGFGLPVLEAMSFGCPIVTSNTSSLPEVAGDAALLVNPDEAIAIAEAMRKIISDQQLRDELIQRGIIRSKLYSWEKTAEATLKAYKTLGK